MPYKVLIDEVTILKKIGELIDQQGNKHDEHASVTYYFGDVVPDTEVAPTVVRAYDDEDHHVRSLLLRTDEAPTVPERKPSALPQPVDEVPAPEPTVEPFTEPLSAPTEAIAAAEEEEKAEEDEAPAPRRPSTRR
jgi:hypothetical protein